MEPLSAAKHFALLKNPHRLRILTLLSKEEMCVSRLAEATDLKQPALSHHLRRMKAAGLVRMRTEGPFHFFSVDAARANPFLQLVDTASKAPDAELVYVWDMETGKQEWFGDVDRAFGTKPGAFPRTVDAWEERIHPDDYTRVVAAAERHLRSGSPFSVQYRIRKDCGTYSTWLDCGSAMRDEDDRPYKWVGMTREVAA